jgi:hypothetical protein
MIFQLLEKRFERVQRVLKPDVRFYGGTGDVPRPPDLFRLQIPIPAPTPHGGLRHIKDVGNLLDRKGLCRLGHPKGVVG